MHVYHLASFSGNIGDVANHEAFYIQLQKKIEKEIQVTKDEIRDYYQSINIRQFDEYFVEQVNKHDLFIIGGGNFFELCWDYSENGTTFNLSNKLLQKIKVPIFINGIGVDDNKGTSPKNIDNFREFLNTLFLHTEVFFTVRNDGSYDIFNNYFAEYIDRIIEIPDFGFFVSEVPLVNKHKSRRKVKSIGFNIALDMPQIRYAKLDYEKYLKEVAKQIDLLLSKTDFHIYLFAHIQSDYQAILALLNYVENKHARTRISISALVQERELETFKLYKECEIVFAMRFHANVCAISLGVPTFGMVSYPKHELLYDKIELSDRKCSLNNIDFMKTFQEEVQRLIEFPKYLDVLRKRYKKIMENLIVEKDIMFDQWVEWYVSTQRNKDS